MSSYFDIQNRRYLGNKFKLLEFITSVVSDNCRDVSVFADLFSGTGSVASAFQSSCDIITNDILYSNYLCNFAWFGNDKFDTDKIIELIESFNAIENPSENYMSQTFGNTYFSYDDCKKIGEIRIKIEQLKAQKSITKREYAILITSLLYAMDRIAKTCGHYDAYRKNVNFDEHLELRIPHIPTTGNSNNFCYNKDIMVVAPKIKADVVYLDPPYNSRQYSDLYHVLENVACWEKPQTYGVARKMKRTSLKSVFCTRQAPKAFAALVELLNARYILLSYNNMSHKGNDRSNARISDDDIMAILSRKGDVKVFTLDYRAFSAGKSNIKENKERLFLCSCQ